MRWAREGCLAWLVDAPRFRVSRWTLKTGYRYIAQIAGNGQPEKIIGGFDDPKEAARAVEDEYQRQRSNTDGGRSRQSG